MGEQGQGSTGNSNFLCSEYDDRDDLAANETNSRERDHSCNTGKITATGNTEGGRWTSDIQGIQGRLIT